MAKPAKGTRPRGAVPAALRRGQRKPDKNYPGLGRQPKPSPVVRWWAIAVGLCALVIGIIAARDVWVVLSGDPQQQWLVPLAQSVTGQAPQVEKWGLTIAAIVVGLVLMLVAFMPRRTTHWRLTTPSVSDTSAVSLWVRPVDVARHASATARRVPGVTGALTQATRRRVELTVDGEIDDAGLADRVHQAVAQALMPLHQTPQVVVNVQELPSEGDDFVS